MVKTVDLLSTSIFLFSTSTILLSKNWILGEHVFKNKENKENRRTCLVPSFFFNFILKNIENTKFREQEQF